MPWLGVQPGPGSQPVLRRNPFLACDSIEGEVYADPRYAVLRLIRPGSCLPGIICASIEALNGRLILTSNLGNYAVNSHVVVLGPLPGQTGPVPSLTAHMGDYTEAQLMYMHQQSVGSCADRGELQAFRQPYLLDLRAVYQTMVSYAPEV